MSCTPVVQLRPSAQLARLQNARGVQAENRLCKCGKHRTLPTFTQPRRRLRDNLGVKPKPRNSSYQWLRNRGQVKVAPEIIEVAIERTLGASRQTRLQGRGGGLPFNSGLDRLQASNSRFEHALCSSADSMRSIWVYRTPSPKAWRTAVVSLAAQWAMVSSHFPRLCTHKFTEQIDEHHLVD